MMAILYVVTIVCVGNWLLKRYVPREYYRDPETGVIER